MVKRVVTKIGDVFSAKIDETHKKYFQLIAFDLTQLNSDVIRAFKKVYPINEDYNLSEIINGEIDFYAHCVTKWGVKMNLWEKVGCINDVGPLNKILFKGTNDDGNYPGQYIVSNNWYVWHISDEKFTWVGKLVGENRKAEIGLLMTPQDIMDRLQTGKYNMPFYPEFE